MPGSRPELVDQLLDRTFVHRSGSGRGQHPMAAVVESGAILFVILVVILFVVVVVVIVVVLELVHRESVERGQTERGEVEATRSVRPADPQPCRR